MATSPRDQRRRYDTDLTDEQWALVEPLLPPPSKDGPKPKHPRREIVNAILYVVRTGGAWRHLPTDFPPWGTVFWWFQRWSRDGVVTVCTIGCGMRCAMPRAATRWPRRASWTPSRSRPATPPRPPLGAMTQVSGSTGASGTSWSIPSAC